MNPPLSPAQAKLQIDRSVKFARRAAVHISHARVALAGRCESARIGDAQLFYLLLAAAGKERPLDWMCGQIDAMPALPCD